MTNTKKLKAIFVEYGKSQSDVARMIGISNASLSDKLNNKKEFKVKEIQRLCECFNIQDKDSIFFAVNVE